MYKDFAYYYDSLMYDVPYNQWADYIEQIFIKFNITPQIIADLGCGTGSLLLELSKKGYEMIGIDLSQDMLNCTKQKALEMGMDAILLNQDMTEFELYGTVDAIICTMDSVNYIVDPQKLSRMFSLVKNYLNPNGLFIFDINTKYKFLNKLSKEVFFDVSEDISFIWQNDFDKEKNICTFDLTFFIKEDRLYRRFDEIHYERAYSDKELNNIIKESGLSLLGVFDELTFDIPSKESERIFYVLQKTI